MKRTHVRWRPGRLAMLGLLLTSAVVMSIRARMDGPVTRPASARVYVVQPGDTVWAIAARIAGPAQDPRPVVDRLLAANHLHDPLITVGERLAIPP